MKFKVLFMALVMAFMVVQSSFGAVEKSSEKEAVKPSFDQVMIEKAKEAVMNSLKDPESARFRHVHIKLGDPSSVQGEVNAKNSYGAYNGYQKFYVEIDRDNISTEREIVKLIEESHGTCWESEKVLAKNHVVREKPKEIRIYKDMFVEGW
jgi:flagellar motor protein MotB